MPAVRLMIHNLECYSKYLVLVLAKGDVPHQ